MKTKLAFALAGILAMSTTPAFGAESVSATPTASKVLVNGTPQAFEAYNINDNNYFKLRDIAYVLKDTDAAFSVDWDSETNSVALGTAGTYTPTGNELKISSGREAKNAVASNSTILIDGAAASLKAYNIDGNNYFKLRDLGASLGFDIGWDNASQTISMKTKPNTIVKPETEKMTLTEEEAKEMGFSAEVVGIYYSRGFFVEGVNLADGSPISAVSANSVTVNGHKATTDVYTGAYAASLMEDKSLADTDFYLHYNFPAGTMYLNTESYLPDYGKRNDISIEYSLQTIDGKIYTYAASYNLQCDGNGGIWFE